MMRKLYCIIMLCVGIDTHAQHYFNLRHTLNSVSTILTSVLESNNKYYTTGICLDSINHPQGFGYWAIKFAVFDKAGNKLRDTFYQKNGRNLYSWNSKLQKGNDDNFLLAVDAVDTINGWYLMIYRFDSLGNILMEKEFLKPVCTGLNPTNDLWRLTDFKPDGYGNWLMLSTITCPIASGVKGNLFLMKLDSSFNVIWHKQYGDAALNDIAGKILVDGNSYILSGGRTNDNLTSKNFIYRAELIKTDTAGNVQWTYLSPASRLTNAIQDVIKTQDGGYVYCGQGDGWEEAHPNGVSAHVNWNAWVEKIDANRNIVWGRKIYNKYEFNTAFIAVKEASDGRLKLFGKKYEADSIGANNWHGHSRGWFITLGANGDSLQERVYSIINTCLDKHQIYDVKQTTDGGYIMVGEATDDCPSFTAPNQRAWLIKVDSNGCMSLTDPQCHPTGTGTYPEQLSAIELYPNPVNDILYINNIRKEQLSITIYDLLGRAVQQQQLHVGMNELQLHILPAGVYVYKLTDDRNVVQQGKLVKE